MELARFFKKLEAKYGNSLQFLSDHPNPGNRVRAIEAELQTMPQQTYRPDDGVEFEHIKDLVLHLPGSRQLRSSYQDAHNPSYVVPTTQVTDQRETRVDGHAALLTILSAQSPLEGETEVDAIVTVPQPDGLFYLTFTAPRSEWAAVQPVFDDIVRSLRLH